MLVEDHVQHAYHHPSLPQRDTWTGEHVKVDWPPTSCITGGARDGGRPDLSQSEGYHERAVVVAARSDQGDKR